MSGRGSVTIVGMENLRQTMAQFPVTAQQRIEKFALQRTAARLLVYLKRAAPRGKSGKLDKSLRMYRSKNIQGRFIVGLASRFYYKTLEYGRQPFKRRYRKRGKGSRTKHQWSGSKPMHPWFAAAWSRYQTDIASFLVAQTKIELEIEARRYAARSPRGRR